MIKPDNRGLLCDLHIHSCLSPCADDDMTVNNIINMSLLNGVSLIALTDHNSAKNCPALMAAAEGKQNVIPGMELCTAEEIHVVCLFPTLEKAMDFDEYVYAHTPKVKNKPHIFGNQLILNHFDEITSHEDKLLLTAADIPFNSVPALISSFGGIAFPAHIDRDSYSALAVLGSLPEKMDCPVVEVFDPDKFLAIPQNLQHVTGKKVITNSDAHNLWKIKQESEWEKLPIAEASFGGLSEYLYQK